MAINRAIPWESYLFLHSLRTLPRKDRLKHLTEDNRVFYGNYKDLKKELGREPTWKELQERTGLSSPPSISNHFMRLRTAGLVPDPNGVVPDDVTWRNAFGRMLDLLGLWIAAHPEDKLVENTKEVARMMGMPPRVDFPEAPDWFKGMFRETHRTGEPASRNKRTGVWSKKRPKKKKAMA